jgi:hypothetical protein
MLSREKLISFIIFGLFVFSPLVPSWQSTLLGHWYGIYLYWFLLIVMCAAAQFRRRQPGQD